MSIKEDIEKVESKMKELENESWAMVLLKDYKKANKRLFVVILVILSMWLATIGAFIYYINTTTFEEDYREQTIEDFIKVLEQEAETQQQKQELRQALQNAMM